MYKADLGMEEKSRHIYGRSRLRSPSAPFFGSYFTADSLPHLGEASSNDIGAAGILELWYVHVIAVLAHGRVLLLIQYSFQTVCIYAITLSNII